MKIVLFKKFRYIANVVGVLERNFNSESKMLIQWIKVIPYTHYFMVISEQKKRTKITPTVMPLDVPFLAV